MESPYATSCQWIILTNILSCKVSKLSQIIVKILDTLRFWVPFGGSGATYTVHLGLIGKLVVDFLFMLLELFSLDVMAEALWANIDWKIGVFAPTGSVWPKISSRRDRPTNHCLCQKTRMNGIRMCSQVSFVLSQYTRLTDRQTDRRTDGQTKRPWQYCALHYMQMHGNNEKNTNYTVSGKKRCHLIFYHNFAKS